jgi:hypothetical protein
MINKKQSEEIIYTPKKAALYSLAGFTDIVILQFFSFLIFTFYYAVVGLDVNLITIAFILSLVHYLIGPVLNMVDVSPILLQGFIHYAL